MGCACFFVCEGRGRGHRERGGPGGASLPPAREWRVWGPGMTAGEGPLRNFPDGTSRGSGKGNIEAETLAQLRLSVRPSISLRTNGQPNPGYAMVFVRKRTNGQPWLRLCSGFRAQEDERTAYSQAVQWVSCARGRTDSPVPGCAMGFVRKRTNGQPWLRLCSGFRTLE